MLILSIATTLCSFAQTLTPKQDQFIRKTIATQYGDMYNKEVLEKGQDVFAIVGKDTIYNPHGYHYVFKLASDKQSLEISTLTYKDELLTGDYFTEITKAFI